MAFQAALPFSSLEKSYWHASFALQVMKSAHHKTRQKS